MESPALSIILPFYNAERTLAEALDSIVAQSFEEFELLAVDDGSEDASADRVRAWARRDRRVQLLSLPRSGVVGAMNAGLAAARAPIIARMDADDRMHPTRLEKQMRWLEDHPDLDLVGTQVRLFPAQGIRMGFADYVAWQNACVTPEAIADNAYIELPVAHPTFMFRKSVIELVGGYRDGDFPEDYELVLRLLHAGRRIGKVPEILLDWREGDDRLTRTDGRYRREAFDRVRADYLIRDRRLHSGRPLAFWGAGRRSRRRADRLIAEGIGPTAWIDVDPAKLGRYYAGAQVFPPEWLDRRERPFVLSFVNNRGVREQIAGYLHSLGYTPGSDYLMVG